MIYQASAIFNSAHPIIIKITINFPKFLSARKKSAHFINSFRDREDFRDPRPKRPCSFLTTTTQKLLKYLMFFLDFYQHTKNQFIQLIPSWGTTNFRVLRPEWQHPFFVTPTPIFFDQLLNFMNLYQHAENQAFSSFWSRDTVDLKILQSYWLRAFWPIS